MELKKYILKTIKKIQNPEMIIKIYLYVRDIVEGRDEC